MSTRAIITFEDDDEVKKGVYQHWDGYPEGLGQKIVNTLKEKYIDNEGKVGVKNDGKLNTAIQGFINVEIKGHVGGWSVFGEECYCHSPEFVMRDGIGRTELFKGEDFDDVMVSYEYFIDKANEKIEIYDDWESEKLYEIDLREVEKGKTDIDELIQ